MLNGCSMGAEWMLRPTFILDIDSVILKIGCRKFTFQNRLQRYNFFLIYANFLTKKVIFTVVVFETLRNTKRNHTLFA